MDWKEISTKVAELYGIVSNWSYDHPVQTDLLVVLGVFGSLALILSSRAKMRRRARRILWGVRMKRSRNRLAYEKTMIAFALEECLFEMVFRGDTTEERANEWRHAFAIRYQMDELLPRKDKNSVKRGIKYRLNHGLHRIKAIIPGGHPLKDLKIDPTYKPVAMIVGASLRKSKYATAA